MAGDIPIIMVVPVAGEPGIQVGGPVVIHDRLDIQAGLTGQPHGQRPAGAEAHQADRLPMAHRCGRTWRPVEMPPGRSSPGCSPGSAWSPSWLSCSAAVCVGMFGERRRQGITGEVNTSVGQTRDSHGSTSGRNRLMLLPLDRFDCGRDIACPVAAWHARPPGPSQTENILPIAAIRRNPQIQKITQIRMNVRRIVANGAILPIRGEYAGVCGPAPPDRRDRWRWDGSCWAAGSRPRRSPTRMRCGWRSRWRAGSHYVGQGIELRVGVVARGSGRSWTRRRSPGRMCG